MNLSLIPSVCLLVLSEVFSLKGSSALLVLL